MKFEYWVDNRDVRDKFYKGPLIIPYDETNVRHKRVIGQITMDEAINTIKNILTNDLKTLEGSIENQIKLIKERENTKPELLFSEFYNPDFYFLIDRLVKEGYKFEPIGEDILTIKRLRDIANLQRCEIWEEGNPWKIGINLKTQISISERIFEPLYRKHKNDIGWFWDKDYLKLSKYKSLKELQEAYENCKLRLKEIC